MLKNALSSKCPVSAQVVALFPIDRLKTIHSKEVRLNILKTRTKELVEGFKKKVTSKIHLTILLFPTLYIRI
jgi:hypothetical protein